jgi:hypothetical protein
MNHISTLTLILFKDQNLYAYEYDDKNGNMQIEYGFTSVGDALNGAFKRLKTFMVLPDVESR